MSRNTGFDMSTVSSVEELPYFDRSMSDSCFSKLMLSTPVAPSPSRTTISKVLPPSGTTIILTRASSMYCPELVFRHITLLAKA